MKIRLKASLSGVNSIGTWAIFNRDSVLDGQVKRRSDASIRKQGIVDIVSGAFLIPNVSACNFEILSDEPCLPAYIPDDLTQKRWIPEDREESIWE